MDHSLTAATDGCPQVPRGASEEEAERCDALLASCSLLGGASDRMSDTKHSRACVLSVLVEHC